MNDSDVRHLDFNLLKGLHALLLTHSVSGAAKRTGVTQSAMSATLGKLRVVYGDPLLVRRGNQMLPTPLAERLQPLVSDAMDGVRGALIIVWPKWS